MKYLFALLLSCVAFTALAQEDKLIMDKIASQVASKIGFLELSLVNLQVKLEAAQADIDKLKKELESAVKK